MWGSRQGVVKQRRWKSELVIAESPESISVDSPSARFKSNYAKEVVQDVRCNKSGRYSHPGYAFQSQNEFSDLSGTREHLFRSRSNSDLMRSQRRSVTIQAELPNKDDSLAWMSATTFRRILDKQEVAELGCNNCGTVKPLVKMTAERRESGSDLDQLRNMNRVKDCLNLDLKEERQWTNVCSIFEQRKLSTPINGADQNVVVSKQVVVDLRNDHEQSYKNECTRLKEQNELLMSEIHSLRKEKRSGDYYEKEIEALRSQLKSAENDRRSYESISTRLMFLLEHISSPIDKTLLDSIRGEMLALSGKLTERPRSELKCISNRPSRSLIKDSKTIKPSRSTSMNPQLNYTSFNDSVPTNSSLPTPLDLSNSGSIFTSSPPCSKSKKYYENIEVFDSLYKDIVDEQGWTFLKNEKPYFTKSKKEANSKVKFDRQAAIKTKISNSSLMLDDSKNFGKQKSHKIMRSVKWFRAKEKSLSATPNKKNYI